MENGIMLGARTIRCKRVLGSVRPAEPAYTDRKRDSEQDEEAYRGDDNFLRSARN